MTVTLIVMEPGGQWPGQVIGCEDLVAVRDDAEGLLDRTREKIEALRRRGLPVRVGVLACNEASDVAARTRRADVARVLLGAVAAVGFGRLVLTSPDQPSMRLRSELLTLAGSLSHEVAGATATVSVRFGGLDRKEIDRAEGFGAIVGHALRRVPCIQQ